MDEILHNIESPAESFDFEADYNKKGKQLLRKSTLPDRYSKKNHKNPKIEKNWILYFSRLQGRSAISVIFSSLICLLSF